MSLFLAFVMLLSSLNVSPLGVYATSVENEISIDGREESSTGDTEYEITPGKTSVTVTKAWNDANDRDGKRLNEVKVKLIKNVKQFSDVVVLNADNKWTYTWTELDAKENGKDVAYTVEENEVPTGYKAAVSGNAVKGFTITNSYTTENITINGTKVWEDNNNSDKVRPSEITVHLYADRRQHEYGSIYCPSASRDSRCFRVCLLRKQA